ncbi:MAG: hypothetical protein ACP5QK_12005 [Myxococcota bacterium]
MNGRHEIISFIVELMKEGLNYSNIKRTIIIKFGLSEEVADGYVKEAFETVSFLSKNKELSIREKRLSILVGISIAILSAIFYAMVIIKSGYNLVFFILFTAFLISKSVYLVALRKTVTFLQMLCGLLTIFSYLLGEYIIYLSILKKEISQRGVLIKSQYYFFFKSIQTYITEYLTKKSISEILLLFLAVLFAVSLFTSPKIKRIRD